MDGAVELARRIAARELSRAEALELHLGRIERLNPRLNALTSVLEPGPAVAGPLAGVPFSVKDNIDVAGTPTTFGLRGPHRAAGHDAPDVAHLRAAGAVPVGRGNMPDLALRWHTDNALAGPTLNLHDPSLSPGGSSGGDAVAVASGMVAFALGSDYGGSLRVPAALAGVCTLRPTPGRIAMATVAPGMTRQLMATDGPLARRVEDLALVLEIMARPSPRDLRHTPAASPAPAGPVRIAVTGEDPALHRAAAALEDAGHSVDHVDPPHVGELAQAWLDLVEFEARLTALPRLREAGSEGTRRSAEALFALAAPLDGEGYARGLMRRHALLADWAAFLAVHPVLLGPVSYAAPWPVGHDQGGPEALRDEWWGFRLTVATAALGVPALALPAGAPPEAVQLVAAPWQEALLLRLAGELEARLSP